MFSRTPIPVIFACAKCGLLYVATQERHRDKSAGRFDCTDCGRMVHSWAGVYDYPVWEPLVLKPSGRRWH